MSKKYHKSVLFILILISSLFLSRTVSAFEENIGINAEPTGEIKVVTSLSVIADWAANIGGDLFSPVSIVTGAEDPHTFQLLAQDQQLIGNSDLFIVFGIEGLEPWVDMVLQADPTINVFYLATEDIIEIDPITSDPNPHIWMSPVLVKDFVINVTDEIILLDFEHQSEYEINRDNYLLELDSLILKIQAENQFIGLKVVVHHPSYMYFLDMLGVIRVAVIEEHEGSEPSAQHIGEVIDTMKEENVSIIITQPQIEEKSIIQIARETDAKVAKLTPLLGIDNDTNTYIKMMEFNLLALANPEDVSEEGWIVTAVIVGSVFFGVIAIVLALFRFKK